MVSGASDPSVRNLNFDCTHQCTRSSLAVLEIQDGAAEWARDKLRLRRERRRVRSTPGDAQQLLFGGRGLRGHRTLPSSKLPWAFSGSGNSDLRDITRPSTALWPVNAASCRGPDVRERRCVSSLRGPSLQPSRVVPTFLNADGHGLDHVLGVRWEQHGTYTGRIHRPPTFEVFL